MKRTLVAIGVSASVLLGCPGGDMSADGGSTGGGRPSGTGGGTSSGMGGGSSTGGSGGSSAGGGASVGETKVGNVTLVQTFTPTPPQGELATYSATASFLVFAGAMAPVGSPCTQTPEGSCLVTLCSVPSLDAGALDGGTFDGGLPDAGPPPVAPNAGTIDVTADASVSLVPGADGRYAPQQTPFGQSAVLFRSGGDVRVKAAGATVPAFDKTFKAGPIINVTSPVLSFTNAPTVQRSAGLSIQWSGGASGGSTAKVIVNASQASLGVSSSVQCTFDASAGVGMIPPSALMKLSAGQTTVVVSAPASLGFKQDGWDVTLTAIVGSTPNNGIGFLNLQ